ncbi:putative phage abortive infection protein [Enterococcus thailandicus]|uniref:putative phage abortive infection protein n=1 Tax=Enterococcus thailandicus TaxID=417368 RepID=UPI0035DACCAA
MKVGKKRMNPKNKKIVFSGGAIGATITFVTLLAIYKIGDGWLGFWGGVIGSAIGVIGAFLVLKEQLDEEREQNRKQQVDNTFFNLLDMHLKMKDTLKEEKNKFGSFYEDMKLNSDKMINWIGIRKIIESDSIIENLDIIFEAYIEKMKEQLIELDIDASSIPSENSEKLGYLINQVSENYEDGKDGEEENDKKFYLVSAKLSTAASEVLKLMDQIKSGIYGDDIKALLFEVYNNMLEYDITTDVNEVIKSLVIEAKKYHNKDGRYELIRELSDKEEVVNCTSDKHYTELGSYFRLIHRIIKYLNDNVEDPQDKNNYIGFLRATVDETEMLVIFYNAYYTKRGEGLGKQLSKTTFFGKPGELGENQGFIQHFNREKLLWPEDDLIRMGQNKIK